MPLNSASPTSTPQNPMTSPNHPHAHIPSDSHFSHKSTPDLAQAIMLMTQELRRRENPTQRAKAKEPDTFDGSDPKKLNTFILLCNLYFRHNPSYSDDETKVTFALSYLRGTALEYFEPSILDSSANPNWLYDWSAFIRTLRTHFGPIDPTGDAEEDIDNLKMSENDQIVKYNVKFNQLAIQTGWDDSVLRHRYYSGLAERIKDIMGQQRKPSTLAAMKNLAHSIDSRHWERLHEKSRSRTSAPHSAFSNSDTPTSSTHYSAPSEISDKFPKLTISDTLGKDGKLTAQERQRRFDNNLCLCCGGTGHKVKECPKSLAKANVTQPMEISDSETSDYNDSDYENSESNSDSEDSGNSDPYISDCDISGSDNSNSDDPDSDDSDPENSDHSVPANSDSGNSGLESPEDSE